MSLNPLPRQEADPTVVNLLVGSIQGSASYAVHRAKGSRSWILMHTFGGKGVATVPGREVECLPGSLTLIAPNVEHTYGTLLSGDPKTGFWNLNWAHFHPRLHWEQLLRWPNQTGSVRTISVAGDQVSQLFTQLIDLAVTLNEWDDRLAMLRFEEILLIGRRAAQSDEAPMFDERIQRAVDLMNTAYASPIGLQELADSAGLSISRFSHRFTEVMGQPPRQYLERQRIRRAQQLLAAGTAPIRSIAERVGFANEFYFSRRFKDLTGMSPSDYRRGA